MLRHPSLRTLSRQHHHALALCVLIRRELERASPDLESLADRTLRQFHTDIRDHFLLEEQILFPATVAELGPMPLVEQLVAEHRRLEQLAAGIAAQESSTSLAAFAELLHAHVRLEENELFEHIQSRLGPETLARLGEELARGSGPSCGLTGNS
jgi:hemerythrin-like domain-containing protein